MTAAYEMVRGIEDAFWLSAWASAIEEEGGRLPRLINRKTADAMPDSVKTAARRYAIRLERANGMKLRDIATAAARADGRPISPEELGYDLAMQGLGHGVSWSDNHAEFPITLPRVEVYAYRTNSHWEIEVSGAPRARRRRQ